MHWHDKFSLPNTDKNTLCLVYKSVPYDKGDLSLGMVDSYALMIWVSHKGYFVYENNPSLFLENDSVIKWTYIEDEDHLKYDTLNIDKSNIDWDAYFMNMALLASLRSKDTTKVGSVLVLDKRVVGMGYNGFPTGIDESKLPKSRTGNFLDIKYSYTIHAEQNCIYNSTLYDISGSTLYVTLFPCHECAKIILQKRIKEVVYLSDFHSEDPPYQASRRLFALSDVAIRQYNGSILVGENLN
jgi:dCMP deaminase